MPYTLKVNGRTYHVDSILATFDTKSEARKYRSSVRGQYAMTVFTVAILTTAEGHTVPGRGFQMRDKFQVALITK